MPQFSWAKLEMVDWVLVFVKCVVLKTITNVAKHILPNQDNLEKHMGKHQIKHNVPIKGLIKFIMRKITNIVGTWCYLLFDDLILFYNVSDDMAVENCHKNVQFATLFHILQNRQAWLNMKL